MLFTKAMTRILDQKDEPNAKQAALAAVQRTTLKDNWEFSAVASDASPDVKEEWASCSIPTSVHVELQKAGKIPDFHKGLNEWEVQCE